MKIRTTLSIILSVVAMALSIATPTTAGVVLYDVDFGTPPHTVGSPPATGGGPPPRDTVSSVNFGTPTVVSVLGALTDQPLEFDTFDLEGDQIEFELFDLPSFDFYTTEAEVLIDTSTVGSFTIFHDTPTIRLIVFGGGVIIVIIPDVEFTLIGNYTPGVPILVRSEIDLLANTWEVFLDNALAHSGSFGGATELLMVRFTTSLVNNTPGNATLAGIDNVVITGGDGPFPCPTDTNGDGVTNVLDLIELLLCFGQPAIPGCVGEDINEDGTVNVLDLIALLLAFGTACP